MTNFKSVVLFVLLFFVFISPLDATSGCCSHHGGVDCSEKQSDGTVVCSDGWLGSSCSYDSMKKCDGFISDVSDADTDTVDNNSDTNDSGSGAIWTIIAGTVGFGYLYSKKGKVK